MTKTELRKPQHQPSNAPVNHRQLKELRRIDQGQPELFRGVRQRLASYGLAFRRNGVWQLTTQGRELIAA